MEEGKNRTEGCQCGACAGRHCQGCCGGHHHCCGRHCLVRLVLTLLVLAVVFWIGVRVGEMKMFFYESEVYNAGTLKNGAVAPNQLERGTWFMGPWMMNPWFYETGGSATSTAK